MTLLAGVDDGRVAHLIATSNKRELAAAFLLADEKRERYEAALREIARWDRFKTLGYEGPKRVAVKALGGKDE